MLEHVSIPARRARPGFMALTVLGALLVTPLFGLMAESLHDEKQAMAAIAEEADEHLRDEMIDLGWRPVSEGPAASSAQRLNRLGSN